MKRKHKGAIQILAVATIAGGTLWWLWGRRRAPKTELPGVGDLPPPKEDQGGIVSDEPAVSPPEDEAPAAEPVSIVELEAQDPTMGRFYQVVRGDRLGGTGRAGIAYRALRQKALEVAQARGDEDPEGYAQRVAGSVTNRTRYLDLILCSGFNDILYGTYGYTDKAHAGPHGRSIVLRPIHPDNRTLIANGEAPIRNVTMLSPDERRAGKRANAVDREFAEGFEYLWLPDIDGDALYDDGEITTEGLRWADGSSVMWAPPQVAQLGTGLFEDPGLQLYGCGDGGLVAE